MPETGAPRNRYHAIFEYIFRKHWKDGVKEFVFERPEIEEAARKLKIALPKNVGDVVYSNRYRTALPKLITDTQPKGLEWIIEGAGAQNIDSSSRPRHAFAHGRIWRKPLSRMLRRKSSSATNSTTSKLFWPLSATTD